MELPNKMYPPKPGRKKHYHQRQGVEDKGNVYKQTLFNPFLPSHFTINQPSSSPFVLNPFHYLLLFVQISKKVLGSNHFVAHFPMGPPVHT